MSEDRTPGRARPAVRPPLLGAIPFYYYDDLAPAVRWYEERLGLRRAWDGGWAVVFELPGGARLGLVDAARGFLRPVAGENKGALISLEVGDVLAWHAYLAAFDDTRFVTPVGVATDGLTEMFVVRDPGGYPVEFFRWRRAAGST
jgi:catechol 2,3-dioxygenase-like lactoylglutathione lyase family enzyme